MSTSLTALAPEVSGAIIEAAIGGLWQYLIKRHSNEDAVLIFLHLVSKLDGSAREHAVDLVLRAPHDNKRR